MISKNILKGLVLSAAFLLGPAQAVSIGGYDIGAFANSFDGGSGSFTSNGFMPDVVIDESVDTWAKADTVGNSLILGFASGTLVNDTGDDLVLFGIGTGEDTFDLTIGVTTVTGLTATDSGSNTPDGFQLNAIAVDLTAFAIGGLVSVTSITLTFQDTTSEFGLAGALNPPPVVVPVPAAVWLFGSGLLGLVGVARRKK